MFKDVTFKISGQNKPTYHSNHAYFVTYIGFDIFLPQYLGDLNNSYSVVLNKGRIVPSADHFPKYRSTRLNLANF